MKVAFVGMGVMGAPMAGHLLSKGHEVKVWNRTATKSEPLLKQGATTCSNIEEVPTDCAVVLLCVSRSEDVRECIEKMSPKAAPGILFVDHSTIDEDTALSLHASLAKTGHKFLDAPITGGSMGAQKGQLTIFVGGEQADFDTAKPLLDCYAKRAELVGGPGKGQLTKMANQIAVAGALLALCESLAFAEKAGLDVAKTRDLLSGGAAGSWAFENYGPKILSKDWTPGFSVKNQQKDLVYCLETAKKLKAELPGTSLVHSLLDQLVNQGREEETTAALYEVLTGQPKVS